MRCSKPQTEDTFWGGYSSSTISGDKSENSKGGSDIWVVKIDAAGSKEWDKTFGGNDSDGLQALQQTADGGYILGGNSTSNASGDKSEDSKGGLDYWIIKLDAAGSKEWDKTIGGNDNDGLQALQQTTDEGYILGGYSKSNASGNKSEDSNGGIEGFDGWVVKLNAVGCQQWDKTIGGTKNEFLSDLQETTNGGYILGGGRHRRRNGRF